MTVAGSLSCATELPSDAIEAQVRSYFTEREIEPQSITCPPGLRAEAGQTLVCDVAIDGQQVPVVVETTDEQGGLSLRPRYATLVTARLEPEIARSLRGQGHAVTGVACRGQVWVAHPQAEGHCEVTVQDGRRYAWRGVFSGEGSKHRAVVTPIGPREGAP